MKTIKCVKEYQMVGCQIPIGTILSEIDSKIGNTSYKDKKGITYNFDNSEILFSPIFRESFINLKGKTYDKQKCNENR
jgi:hypothetical protein